MMIEVIRSNGTDLEATRKHEQGVSIQKAEPLLRLSKHSRNAIEPYPISSPASFSRYENFFVVTRNHRVLLTVPKGWS